MLALEGKDIKTVIIAVFYMFKKFRSNIENKRKKNS